MKTILFAGSSSVGKTTVIRFLVAELRTRLPLALAKIDCLKTHDNELYAQLDLPYVIGLSGDICPDHFLVSNLPELWQWAERKQANTLILETAGLCHRCSPATTQMLAGCVFDCTASALSPGQLGPMLSQADFIVLTKIDLISQAEFEILYQRISQTNPCAIIFPVDGTSGYGVDFISEWILAQDDCASYENDLLRHSMPSGICSYCVGENRVGSAYQQGIVGKILFND